MAASIVKFTSIFGPVSFLRNGLSCSCRHSGTILTTVRLSSTKVGGQESNPPLKKPYTPVGKHDKPETHRDAEKEPLAPFPNDINPETGEKGGPRGPEPTRYGDWERKGRCIDF